MMAPQLLHLELRPPIALFRTTYSSAHHIVVGIHADLRSCHCTHHSAIVPVNHSRVLMQLLQDLIGWRQVLSIVVIVIRVRVVVSIELLLLHVVAVCGGRRHRHVVVGRRIVGRILETDLVHYLQGHVGQLLLLLVMRLLLGQDALRLRHYRWQELLAILQQLEMRRRGRCWGPDGHLLWHLLVFHIVLIKLSSRSYHNNCFNTHTSTSL